MSRVHYWDACDYMGPDLAADIIELLANDFPSVVIALIQDYCRLRFTFKRTADNCLMMSPSIYMPLANMDMEMPDQTTLYRVVTLRAKKRLKANKCIMCDHESNYDPDKNVHECPRSLTTTLNLATRYAQVPAFVSALGRNTSSFTIGYTDSLRDGSALVASRLRASHVESNDYALEWDVA